MPLYGHHDEKLSFKAAYNATLRRGLDQRLAKPNSKPFHTVAEDMDLLPHLNYDNIGDLLALAERSVPHTVYLDVTLK